MGACFNSLLSLSTHSGRGSNKSGSHTSLFFPFPFPWCLVSLAFALLPVMDQEPQVSLKYPFGTSKMGAPSSCHTAFWYHQESKVTPRKKKDSNVTPKNKEKWYKKKCKVTQERKQSDTKKKAKWHQERKQSDTKKEAKWPRRKVKWHLCFFFLVPCCFLSWCHFAFWLLIVNRMLLLGVPLLSFLVSLCFQLLVSLFFLSGCHVSILVSLLLLSCHHVACFLGVTLLSFLGSHFFFLLPFCFQLLVLSLCFLSWCLCFLSWCHVAFFLESRLKPDSLSVIDQQPSLLWAWLSVFRTAERD